MRRQKYLTPNTRKRYSSWSPVGFIFEVRIRTRSCTGRAVVVMSSQIRAAILSRSPGRRAPVLRRARPNLVCPHFRRRLRSARSPRAGSGPPHCCRSSATAPSGRRASPWPLKASWRKGLPARSLERSLATYSGTRKICAARMMSSRKSQGGGDVHPRRVAQLPEKNGRNHAEADDYLQVCADSHGAAQAAPTGNRTRTVRSVPAASPKARAGAATGAGAVTGVVTPSDDAVTRHTRLGSV